MRRTRRLCAIGVSVWSVVVAGGQALAPTVLSPALRAHVEREQFGIVTSIRGLPLGVRDELQTLFGRGTLDIAEPGAPFQATDLIVETIGAMNGSLGQRNRRYRTLTSRFAGDSPPVTAGDSPRHSTPPPAMVAAGAGPI